MEFQSFRIEELTQISYNTSIDLAEQPSKQHSPLTHDSGGGPGTSCRREGGKKDRQIHFDDQATAYNRTKPLKMSPAGENA
jgi:hypothetical protein